MPKTVPCLTNTAARPALWALWQGDVGREEGSR